MQVEPACIITLALLGVTVCAIEPAEDGLPPRHHSAPEESNGERKKERMMDAKKKRPANEYDRERTNEDRRPVIFDGGRIFADPISWSDFFSQVGQLLRNVSGTLRPHNDHVSDRCQTDRPVDMCRTGGRQVTDICLPTICVGKMAATLPLRARHRAAHEANTCPGRHLSDTGRQSGRHSQDIFFILLCAYSMYKLIVMTCTELI